MISRVVVPIDLTEESGRALPVADALARRAGAEVYALVVASAHSDAWAEEADARAFVEAHGLAAAKVVIDQTGDVPGAIAGEAKDPSTVVCMASHGRTVLAELVFGSVADEVLRRGTGPAVLVGPRVDVAAEYDRLLVCVDGTSQADAMVPTAARWIDELGLTPVVVQVVGPRATPSPRSATRVAAELATVGRSGPAIRVEELVADDPATAIGQLAAAEKAALVMVAAGTTGRLARLAHGSTTAALVRAGPAPVIAVPVATDAPPGR